jgi:hypothetical protein
VSSGKAKKGDLFESKIAEDKHVVDYLKTTATTPNVPGTQQEEIRKAKQREANQVIFKKAWGTKTSQKSDDIAQGIRTLGRAEALSRYSKPDNTEKYNVGSQAHENLAQLSYSKDSSRNTLIKEVKTAHDSLMKHWAGLLEQNRVMSMIQSRKLQNKLSAIFNEGESKYFDPKNKKLMTYSLASMLHADAYNHGALDKVESTKDKLQAQLNKLEGKKSRNFGG